MPALRTTMPRCTECGEPAVVTKFVDGKPIHLCFDCLGNPPSLRQQDNKLLIQLGLLKPHSR